MSRRLRRSLDATRRHRTWALAPWLLSVAFSPASGQTAGGTVFVRAGVVSLGQEGVSYGVRRGISLEGGIERGAGTRFGIGANVALTFAPYAGDDYGLIEEWEGQSLDVGRPELSPLPSLRAGATLRHRIGGIVVSIGPEAGLVVDLDAGIRAGPSATVVLGAGAERVQVHVRGGILGMPFAWRAPGGGTVRTATEWWRVLELGASWRWPA